jgi:hypothetical protein
VVFFHGLQSVSWDKAWDHTWRNENEELWPADWLGQDFPSARILSISYDSKALGGGKTMEQTVKELMHDMCILVSGKPAVSCCAVLQYLVQNCNGSWCFHLSCFVHVQVGMLSVKAAVE